MKKNLLSRFKKSAVTMIVKGISEYENDKVIKSVLGKKAAKVNDVEYSNGNSCCDISINDFGIDRMIKKGKGSICFIK